MEQQNKITGKWTRRYANWADAAARERNVARPDQSTTDFVLVRRQRKSIIATVASTTGTLRIRVPCIWCPSQKTNDEQQCSQKLYLVVEPLQIKSNKERANIIFFFNSTGKMLSKKKTGKKKEAKRSSLLISAITLNLYIGYV
jgi:hypothetical protein